MTQSWFYEPGAWVLISLLTLAVVNAASSLMLRKDRRRLLELIKQIHSDPRSNKADRAWLDVAASSSRGTSLLVGSFFAPFIILAAVAIGLFDPMTKKVARDRSERPFREIIEDDHAKMIKLTHGVDPRDGEFWTDPRRKEIEALSDKLDYWTHPASFLWIVFWAILALPFLLLSLFVSGSIMPVVANIWKPLRPSIVAVISSLDRHLPMFHFTR